MRLAPGSQLGPYEIVGSLGAGGMGEVYRARDARLRRDVAVKILPQGLSDAHAAARFQQEAQAVAALSHPNILAIHDVGVQGPITYAVMELLEGQTLRDRLSSGRLSLRRALDYALQIAQGLAAAHARGIIHRDLKPANVFVTNDGVVKILDFGLATTRQASVLATSQMQTGVREEAGVVVGTVGYQSPEQAQGKEVDHRSDIFSFGCVLYELFAGRRAFDGPSSYEIVHQIVHAAPPPVRAAAGDLPVEAEWLVEKCLAKDPDDRYQSARDLVVDLKTAMRHLDSSSSGTAAPSAGGPISGAPRVRRRWIVAASVALLFAAAAAAVVYRGRIAIFPRESATSPLAFERLTTLGTVIDAVIAPDGKYLAYVVSESGRHSLWLRQTDAGNTPLQLIPPRIGGYWGIAFAPQGDAIYYAFKSPEVGAAGALFRIPVLGGQSRKLLDRIDSAVAFSPDGRRVAFVRAQYPEQGVSALMTANADGSGERVVALRRAPEYFSPIFFTTPSWSPDGTMVVSAVEHRGETASASMKAFRASDGVEQPLSDLRWDALARVLWLPDGRVLAIGRTSPGYNQLWTIDPRSGSRRQLTNGLGDYRTVSVTADLRTLLTIVTDIESSVWTVPLETGSAPTRLTKGLYDGLQGISIVPDGRILYTSLQAGGFEIWIMNRDGTGARQVTTEGDNHYPFALPDGRSMLTVSTRGGPPSIWRMTLEGENAAQVTPTAMLMQPAATPDGEWVVFTSIANGVDTLARVPIRGGPVETVLGPHSVRPAVSPDGRLLACFHTDTRATNYKIVVVPLGGTEPIASFDLFGSTGFSMVRWSRDGKALLHNGARDDRANVWLQPIDGSAPRRLTSFAENDAIAFDTMPDGSALIVARGVLNRDAVRARLSP